jgi:hypothetical protein
MSQQLLDTECPLAGILPLGGTMNMSKAGIGTFPNTYWQKKRRENFIAICGMDFEKI